MIKELVRRELSDIIAQALGPDLSDFELIHPQNESFGDFSLNVALKASKRLKQSPMEIAKHLSVVIPSKSSLFEKVEVVVPGFINLRLKNDYLLAEVKEIGEKGDSYGRSERLNGQKIMVEYTDPNPFKEFHVGHLFSNIVGESICRLLECQGASVWRVCYQGDVGLHVAKSIWGMQKLEVEMPADELSLKEKAAFLGRAYALGASAYEEDESSKKEIIEINQKVYRRDPAVLGLWEKGKKWSLDYFEVVYQRLGVAYGRQPAFDRYYPESEAGEVGLRLVKEGLAKGVFEESQGAIVFKGENYGLHTRVFINSLGLPTYEAKELGLVPTKYKDFPYDLCLVVTGSEIDEYFRVVTQALKLIEPKLGEKVKHVSHGMVRLPGGKMSSRTGKVIRGEWLLDEAKKVASEIVGELDGRFRSKEITEWVGLAAVKYALLKGGTNRDIEFNFGESVSFEGNSGPYLQYTYARARSVLRKYETLNSKSETNSNNPKDPKVPRFEIHTSGLVSEEVSLLRTLYRFPEVVEAASQAYQPYLVANFLFDLAQKFNLFYNNLPILGDKAGSSSKLRLGLTRAVAQVIKNGLLLLGIEAPEEM